MRDNHATKSTITVDTESGAITATGAVTYGVVIIIGLFVVGKYFLPFLKGFVNKHKHRIARRRK
jgi:hypothetical protein